MDDASGSGDSPTAEDRVDQSASTGSCGSSVFRVSVLVIATVASAWLVLSKPAAFKRPVMERMTDSTQIGTKVERLNNLTKTTDYISHKKKTKLRETDHVDSPFESIWSTPLPNWAIKRINYKIPRNQELCFTHVGKAGGSAVGCSLGFSLRCGNTTQKDGFLPKLTGHAFHRDVYNCHDDSAHFLFTVRDPIDRVRSAFNYDRPDESCEDSPYLRKMSKFYFDCPFFSIEDYVQSGLKRGGAASNKCKRMARRVLIGTHNVGPTHLYYNYQYYREAVPTDASILVLRNEHLAEDWANIEQLVSRGKGRHENDIQYVKEETFPRMNVNTWSSQDDLYLSVESISILCKVLCNEIQQYKEIMRRAVNINDEQYRVSLDELERKCPVEAASESCQDELPDIRDKLIQERGYTKTSPSFRHGKS